jgi:hypothetical protein
MRSPTWPTRLQTVPFLVTATVPDDGKANTRYTNPQTVVTSSVGLQPSCDRRLRFWIRARAARCRRTPCACCCAPWAACGLTATWTTPSAAPTSRVALDPSSNQIHTNRETDRQTQRKLASSTLRMAHSSSSFVCVCVYVCVCVCVCVCVRVCTLYGCGRVGLRDRDVRSVCGTGASGAAAIGRPAALRLPRTRPDAVWPRAPERSQALADGCGGPTQSRRV